MATFQNIRKNTEYSLNKNTREEYFWRCNEMICKTQEEVKESIKKNLEIIYNITESILISYKKYLTEIKENTYDYNDLIKAFNKIKSDERDYTLENLNVKSLQCIIIITEISIVTSSKEERDSFDKKRIDEFERNYFSNTYMDFDAFYKNMKYDDEFKYLLGEDTKKNYSCCPDLKGALIMVPLGEMSLYELVYTLANDIYLIGITTTNQFADGKFMTPYEFVKHDIIHSINRKNTIQNERITLEYEKKFIDNIHSILNKDNENYSKLMIALFLIMHETFTFELMLGEPQIPFLSFSSIIRNFPEYSTFKDPIGVLDNWRNINYYGGLLPKEVREGTNKDIKDYLNDCFKILKTEWNKFHAVSRASGGSSSSASGSSSINSDPVNPSSNEINTGYIPKYYGPGPEDPQGGGRRRRRKCSKKMKLARRRKTKKQIKSAK